MSLVMLLLTPRHAVIVVVPVAELSIYYIICHFSKTSSQVGKVLCAMALQAVPARILYMGDSRLSFN